MRRNLNLPRFIDPANIETGDTIRVAWRNGGVEHARTAKVYRRIDEGPLTVFYTDEGYEIFHWIPGGPREVKVTLLAVATPEENILSLLGFDELEEEKVA